MILTISTTFQAIRLTDYGLFLLVSRIRLLFIIASLQSNKGEWQT